MMTFATTLTYAYMGVANIGINTNTVPIIAIGVGVGIDYSIYMMDRIREMAAKNGNNWMMQSALPCVLPGWRFASQPSRSFVV